MAIDGLLRTLFLVDNEQCQSPKIDSSQLSVKLLCGFPFFALASLEAWQEYLYPAQTRMHGSQTVLQKFLNYVKNKSCIDEEEI
jgi:hypothetical protein